MIDRLHNRLDIGDRQERPRRPLLSVALLPSAATLGNLICGTLALLCCLLAIRMEYFDIARPTGNPFFLAWFPTYVSMGAYLVVLAMAFDALDGRLARIARHTTEFGAQLDSMADIVSFGAAPALLFLTLLLPLAVPRAGEPVVHTLEWRLGLLGALVYVSCAAIRLARYNAENIEEEAAQPRFHGLPTPGAAAGMVALLVLHEDLVREQADWLGVNWAAGIRHSMGIIALLLGILMVSRLDYVHVFNVYVRREQPLPHLVLLVILVGIGLFSPQVLLLVLASAYILSGIVLRLTRRRPAHNAAGARPAQPEGAAAPPGARS